MALVTILTRKILSLFAVRDFNITKTMMLKQKFKIPSDRAECIEVLCRFPSATASPSRRRSKSSPRLSYSGRAQPLCPGRLGGRSLHTAVIIGAVISLLGAILGLGFMFFMCRKGPSRQPPPQTPDFYDCMAYPDFLPLRPAELNTKKCFAPDESGFSFRRARFFCA